MVLLASKVLGDNVHGFSNILHLKRPETCGGSFPELKAEVLFY